MAYAVVLGDGETFESLDCGAMVVNIPNNMTNIDDIEEWLREGEYGSVQLKEIFDILDRLPSESGAPSTDLLKD